MAKNTIKLKNYSDVMEEKTATAVAITPGALLELTSAGTVQAHSNAAKNTNLIMFACEDELQGAGIDTNYAASAKIQVWIPGRGDVVYARLKANENVAIGDPLESAGDGTLQKHVPDTWTTSNVGTIYSNVIVGIALEALNPNAISRIQVQII